MVKFLFLLFLTTAAHAAYLPYKAAVPLTLTRDTFGCRVANSVQSGCLSSEDWVTFNAKQGTLTFNGPLSLTGSAVSIANFSSSASGIAPASGGGSTNFLRADGTWAAPPGQNLTFVSPLVNSANSVSISNFTNTTAGAAPASGGGTSNFLRADGSWAAPPAASGLANSIGYFNSSGALSSNANFRIDSLGRTVISSIGTGANTSNVGAVGTGASLVVGHVAGVSSILSTSYGAGSMALGVSETNGQVSAQFNGTAAIGYATNAGIVATENHGSLAVGRADGGAQVSANGLSTYAFGYADGNSIIGANGSGSFALGYAAANSTINTTTGKYGSLVGGYSSTSGNITTGGNGSLAWGSADSAGGSVSAGGDGAVAFGRAKNVAISANGTGSLAYGSAQSFGITASGEGALAGGVPATGAVVASGVASQSFGDANTSSGNLSTTLGLGNSNGSYAAIVGGRYANVSGSGTAWNGADALFVLGNGTSSLAKSNALLVTKAGNVTAAGFTGPLTGAVTGTVTGQVYAPDGGVSTPGIAFNSEKNSGLYRVGAGEIALAVNGAQAMDFQKSSGGFGNIGMGGPASLSDNYPLLIQRSAESAGIYQQISNTSTAAYSKASYQLAADGGNNNGEISLFTSATPLAAYANTMTVRPNGNTGSLTLIGGDLATGSVRVFTGGDYTGAGQAAQFNAEGSLTLVKNVASSATPATGISLYPKSDNKLYMKNSAGVESLVAPITTPPPSVSTYTASQAVACGAGVVLMNSTGATTVTLPDASTCTAGVSLRVKNINTGAVTISSSTNIDGASSASLTYRYQAVTLIPANGVWNVW